MGGRMWCYRKQIETVVKRLNLDREITMLLEYADIKGIPEDTAIDEINFALFTSAIKYKPRKSASNLIN